MCRSPCFHHKFFPTVTDKSPLQVHRAGWSSAHYNNYTGRNVILQAEFMQSIFSELGSTVFRTRGPEKRALPAFCEMLYSILQLTHLNSNYFLSELICLPGQTIWTLLIWRHQHGIVLLSKD